MTFIHGNLFGSHGSGHGPIGIIGDILTPGRAISNVIGSVLNPVAGVVNHTTDAAASVVRGAQDTARDMTATLGGTVRGVTGDVKDLGLGLGDDVKGLGGQLLNSPVLLIGGALVLLILLK